MYSFSPKLKQKKTTPLGVAVLIVLQILIAGFQMAQADEAIKPVKINMPIEELRKLARQAGFGVNDNQELVLLSPEEYLSDLRKKDDPILDFISNPALHMLLAVFKEDVAVPNSFDECNEDLPKVLKRIKDSQDSIAMYLAGRCYLMFSEPPNYEEGFKQVQRAARVGFWRSKALLGDLYFYGIGTPIAPKQAYNAYMGNAESTEPDFSINSVIGLMRYEVMFERDRYAGTRLAHAFAITSKNAGREEGEALDKLLKTIHDTADMKKIRKSAKRFSCDYLGKCFD